jgi:hypothetical protein
VRYFDPAYRRSGSQREFALYWPMSAPASCGHCTAGTQHGHILSCKRFAAFLKRSPHTATIEDIRRFQLHVSETGMSICDSQ